jgi:GDPmannose 4,6-dehydratase
MIVNYREAYDIFASNGILFNHESPRRGATFVTKKITREIARLVNGVGGKLVLGNLDATRDWGYAPEFCEGMWRILQHEVPDDFVLATGESHSVRYFVEKAFSHIGIHLAWNGSGVDEKGVISRIDDALFNRSVGRDPDNVKLNDVAVEISPSYYRPTEVDSLIGDASKADRLLGWRASTRCDELIKIMIEADLKAVHNPGSE